MDNASFVQALVLCVFPFPLAFAAVSDLVTMKISNRISILLAGSFVGMAILLAIPLSTFGMHFVAAAIVLAAGFTMFAFGWIGGGDAKLAAVIALWLGFEHTMEFALLSAVLGGLLTLAVISVRDSNLNLMAAKIDWLERFLSGRAGIPYGIALSAAALLIYPTTFWMQPLL